MATVFNTTTDNGHSENYEGAFKTDQPSFTTDMKDPGKHQYKRISKMVLTVLICGDLRMHFPP